MILILSLLALNEGSDVMPLAGLVPFVYLLNRAIGSLVSLSASMGLLREYSPYLLELCAHTDVLFPETGAAIQGGVAAPSLSALDVRELEFGRGTALTRRSRCRFVPARSRLSRARRGVGRRPCC